MEQTALDISSLKFGNFMLDRWLNDEAGFWKSLLNSLPCQVCMIEVYKTMIRAGEVEKNAAEDLGNERMIVAETEVRKMVSFPEQGLLTRLIKAMIVITTLAEKRLIVTSGI